jgi:hypothetical protein
MEESLRGTRTEYTPTTSNLQRMSRASRVIPRVPCSPASRRSNLRSAYPRSGWNDIEIAVPWLNGGRSDCLSPCQATRIVVSLAACTHGNGDARAVAHFDLEGLNTFGIESPSSETEISKFHVARRIDKEVLFSVGRSRGSGSSCFSRDTPRV